MKQQEVFRKTGEILKELSDQYEDLKSTPDNLNDLELELFIANAHFLIDHAEILRKLNLQKLQVQHTLPPHVEEPEAKALVIEEPKAPVIQEPKAAIEEEPKAPVVIPETKRPTAGEPKYFEPLVQQVKPVIKPAEPIQLEISPAKEEQPTPQIDLQTGSDTDSYSFEREEPEVIKHDLVIDEADDWDEEDEVIPLVTEDKTRKFPPVTMEDILDDEPKVADEPKVNDEPKADETQEPNIVPTNPEPVIDNMPKVKEEEPVKETKPLSFNERMSAQLKGQQTTKTEPAQEAIKDIKAAISLNDKLLFVKDLFNGYSLAYSEAIEIVNRFTTFEEADRFLKTNYVTKNNWEGKKTTADKFYALLKRRYA
ncbi:MAG: hypothetical protein V4456_02115 [Bacteroidota bacterium]